MEEWKKSCGILAGVLIVLFTGMLAQGIEFYEPVNATQGHEATNYTEDGTLLLNKYVPYDGATNNVDLGGYNISNVTTLNGVDFRNITVDGTTVIWEIII